jgi:hypothetical protein
MTSQTPIQHRVTETGGLPLIDIAEALADGVHLLLPTCTTGVVIALGDQWQLLASRGPAELGARWRDAVAAQVRDSDDPHEHEGYLVAPFSSVTAHVLLVVEASLELPERVLPIVQPLLDAGGILLDRAIAVQERDRAVRRTVLLCKERPRRLVESLGDLEYALSLLWPDTTVRFYDRAILSGASWSCRRLIRSACDLDRATIAHRPIDAGLLAADLRYQLAIPLREHGGALIVDLPAGGEELDTQSVAAAIAMTRESGHPGHPVTAGVQHA